MGVRHYEREETAWEVNVRLVTFRRMDELTGT